MVKMENGRGEEVATGTAFYGRKQIFAASAISKQCPLVFLAKVP
jgi:hypothetical protein